MNGSPAVRLACSSVPSSRTDAQLMSFLLICSITTSVGVPKVVRSQTAVHFFSVRSDQKRSWAMPEMSSMGRLGVSAGLGMIAAVLEGLFGSWTDAPAVGWDVAALNYCVTTWAVIWPMNPAETAAKARSEDPNRTITDVITLSASVASLATVVMVLISANSVKGVAADALAGLALASIAISWFTVHTI